MKWMSAMEDNVDILILTASFGVGHLSASLGIKEHISKINPSISIEVVDVFQRTMPRFSKIMYKGYDILVKRNQKIYNYFYYKKNKTPKSNTCNLSNQYILTKLKKYIMAKNPKLIISTFPVVSQYLSDIKKNHGLSVPFITCITDVVDGWEWVTPNCDKYFVATKDVKKTMLKMGIKSEKVIVTGIPLREEFLGSLKPLLSFSLPEGGTIVVIMGGGMGLIPKDKNFYHWLNNLEKVTTLVLTGHNKKIFNFISKLNLENIIPLGYTNEVATIMAKADLLITKAGGITVFEAIASELPIILHQLKLGQEIENAKFIHKKSIGKITFNIEDLQYTITGLLNNKDRLMKYRTKIAKLSHDINMRVLAEESIKLLNCL